MLRPVFPIFVDQCDNKVIVKLKVIAFEHETKNTFRSEQVSASDYTVYGCVVRDLLPYV